MHFFTPTFLILSHLAISGEAALFQQHADNFFDPVNDAKHSYTTASAFGINSTGVHSAYASGSWEYITLKDDFDDSVVHLIEVKSSEMVNDKAPSLALICGKKGPFWAVAWGDGNLIDQTFSSNEFAPGGVISRINIRVIIDGNEQLKKSLSIWQMIVEKDRSTMTTYRVPEIFKKLRNASVLKMRVEGYPSDIYDAVFDVSGLEAALEELRPNCKKLPR